jgi:peptidyl-prolyl cis-trans isomerase D
MRKNVGNWLIKLLLGAIVVVFVLWGVGPEQKRTDTTVATVDGEPIGYMEFSRTYQNLMENIRRQFGGNIDEDMIKTLNLKDQAVNQLVDRRVIRMAAEKMGFLVSDEELAASISGIPAFQVNGRFNANAYQQVLGRMGLTPEDFEASHREDLMIQKVGSFVTQTVNVSEDEAKAWYRWQNTTVDIEYVIVDPERFAAIDLSEEELRSHFKANENQYKTVPKIKARYLVFRSGDYKARVQIDDDEVTAYYDENPNEFFSPETVEARHILVQVDKDADDAAVEAARMKAAEIHARVLKGEDFAELAKQLSDGPSKDDGGYLGTFGRGRMVKPFEEKAFAMQAGEISEPIRTDFGWHIIKVENHNAAETLSLEASQNRIRGILTDRKSRALALEDAESAYDMSYGGDDLLMAAERFGVDVESTAPVARNAALPGIANAGKFLETAFSLDAMAISDIQELGNDFYIIQTLEKLPAQIPAYEDVAAAVKQDAFAAKQWVQAEEAAAAMLKDLNEGETLAAIGKGEDLEPRTSGWFKRDEAIPGIGFNPALASAAFKLSKENPYPDQTVRGDKGVVVFRFIDRQVPDIPSGDAELDEIKNQLRQRKQREIYGNWMAEARSQSDIVINSDLLK